MERWRGRVAVVTGASAGIGAAIAYQLQDAGVNVVAMARRADKIQDAVNAARKAAESRHRSQIGKAPERGQLHCVKCDVSKEDEVLEAFKWVKDNLGGVDILVNNAGVGGNTTLTETNTNDWKRILDINILGLSICTREAIQQMKARGVDDGHIVHMCSISGHWLPRSPEWSMYYASKHAVRVLTEGLRKELVAAKSKIRVSQICPGLVRTDFFDSFLENQDEVWIQNQLYTEDIADAVLYVLNVPPHVQIHDIIVKPVGEEF
ncbi:hypothetical protein R5R35_009508 [Gryllus longicercus]|uniref:Dehydrogenase/reductase SDR family member 11 n=1 Tax=Gryllus longicercus TaxID=2509291 RepID=A0AAN9Z192_9ORTH